MTASVWSGHWAPLAITSHMWDTEEAEPWDTAQLLQEPARVTGAALPGCVRLSPVSGEWDERPPAQRDGCGARRGQAGHHPMSPGPLVVTLHSPVTRPLSPAWPRRLLLSWAGLHHPELPGDTHWWHPGTGDIATLTRATNERRWRGHGGVTWCLSDTRCQLPGVNWAQCGRHKSHSRHDIWGWQPQHVTKTSQRHGTNNFYLHIRTLSRKTFRHPRWLSWRKKGVTRDDGNVVVDYLPHHPDPQMGVADFQEKTPQWTLLTFQLQISEKVIGIIVFKNKMQHFQY